MAQRIYFSNGTTSENKDEVILKQNSAVPGKNLAGG